MPLSEQEIDGLIQAIGLTKDREINCDQCLATVAEFAEQQLAGKTLSEGLQAVEHHLTLCYECREEYEALRRILRDAAASGSH